MRLLQLLLPENALPSEEGKSHDAGLVGSTTPSSILGLGRVFLLRFKARTAGDNRRWSSDKPRPGESTTEAIGLFS
jgi:hypothetical protein